MNAQRWIALVIIVLIIGVTLTNNMWLPGLIRHKEHATPTQNTDAFVALDTTAISGASLTTYGNAADITPTVDPLVTDLMVVTGIDKLGVGDDPYIIMAGDFMLIDDLHRADGTASIYKIGDKTVALRLDPFDVTPGPDLHVVLSLNSEPRTSADALLPSHIDLGSLKSVKGSQNYDVPDQVVITRYKSVVIYSVSLNLVYSTATLIQVRG